ncbi:shikimate kinase [Solirhodobacter olei]|uniref:shikimate kinase n=1 Tax=Solirhodobacter olei TaxID=2493082 RepID=UPI000FDA231D|nr:shikimate kinase [Solirhodobacter olei]
MKPMQKSVFLFDGAIGVGKSTLGRSVAAKLGFGFIDGDDLSGPGHWFCSSLATSRKIVGASVKALSGRAGVIVAYPVRCTNWLFFLRTFERMGISCHCIGLVADSGAIESRDRRLSTGECARSREMISQGYGRRRFSDLILRTDDADFEATCEHLAEIVRQLSVGLYGPRRCRS